MSTGRPDVIASGDDGDVPNRSHPVLDAVVNSYYPELVQTGRYSKERAVHLLSAVTVLSAALIAALTAGGVSSAATVTKIVALVAVLVWVASSVLFAVAAISPSGADYPEIGYDSPDEYIEYVISESVATQQNVERRLRRAIIATIAALSVSLAAFGIHVISGTNPRWAPSVVTLSDTNLAIDRCPGGQSGAVFVDLSTIGDPMVMFQTVCPDRDYLRYVQSNEILAMEVTKHGEE